MNTTLLEKLNWRYATKVFDPSKKVSDADFEILLESLRLTPSSFGIQPWKFVVVKNLEIREQLVSHSWDQRQVADASHLIVLCRLNQMTEKTVDEYMEYTAETRGVDVSELKGFSDMLKGFVNKMDAEQLSQWMENQVYIALGNLMTSASVLDIDACPIEGFSSTEYDRVLGLEEFGLNSVVLCPVGYRGENDKYAENPKVRFLSEEVILEIS